MSPITATLYNLNYTSKLSAFSETHIKTLKRFSQKAESLKCITNQTLALHDYINSFQCALNMALKAGWDGNLTVQSKDILTFTIPDLQGFRYGFIFQDGKNQKSIVVSPVELNYMQKYASYTETVSLSTNASSPEIDISSLFD